jgi:hypothetical protein
MAAQRSLRPTGQPVSVNVNKRLTPHGEEQEEEDIVVTKCSPVA